MKVLIIQWNSYGNPEPFYKRRGDEVLSVPVDTHADGTKQENQSKIVTQSISEFKPDYVFSYNYFSWVSDVCQKEQVKYVSWVYDSPYMDIYHYSVINPVNYVFVFDYGTYEEFFNEGITTVHYLPLAVDEVRLGCLSEAVFAGEVIDKKYSADISFVGSLYNEPKHRLYDRFDSISPYAKGYLDALISSQKLIHGMNFLEELLSDDVEAQMQKAYHCDPNSLHAMSPKKLYSQFVLSRQVTAVERKEIMELLGKYGCEKGLNLKLFTTDRHINIPGWLNQGEVDYYNEMPYVFRNSKINLNVTLRSILTGIPLRAFDIMGMGGFLLTNYQSEFDEYFVNGEDYVYYENYEDLVHKAEYYLTHEKERKEIAQNGQRKVYEHHTLGKRIAEVERCLGLSD